MTSEFLARSAALNVNPDSFRILDQTKLPENEVWKEIKSTSEMVFAIQRLEIRGAPLIGVGAGLWLGRMALANPALDPQQFLAEAKMLREARPTAVNLMAVVDRVVRVFTESGKSKQAYEKVIAESIKIFHEDVDLCNRIAGQAEKLVKDQSRWLTHCNTGGLATAGRGTALGVLSLASEKGKNIHVYVDETRPLNQGARLTAWECKKQGIPFQLICDNMAGPLMKAGKVNGVIVGADRIVANGDFANKIGTYSLAVLAHHHKIPFYVAAPSTTFDPTLSTGAQIPIEERAGREITTQNFPVYNPAFDVTPAELVTGWIFETGVYEDKDFTSGKVKETLC